MGILDEDVLRVKEQTDLVALIGEHVALKRSGQRFSGLCPFHAEKTPSFSVNPDLGFYYCFGCQASGDAITFLREVEHLDFAEAVERLAGLSGITLRYDDKRVSEDRKRRDRLVEVVETAVAWCHELLLTDPDAGGARKALRSRGFDGDVARRFRLGFAPSGWDKLARHLTKAGFTRRDVVDAGMAFVNKADRLQDHLRGRLLFPIYDREGHAVGFGGRALGDDGPKYKNTGETPIYHKSSLLYGLNWAKADIVGRDQIVLCEGYTDVIAFHLADVTQAVATCGTSLTDDHFRILKNLSRNIVLAYDADAAGQAAAEKCYRWEQEFEMHFGVAALPADRDPAEVWQDDPDALPKVLDVAVPLLQFRLDRRLDAADTTSLEGRARSAEYVADLIAEHPSELVRDQYAVKLSERLDIDADRLRHTVEEARRRGPKPDRPTRSSRVVEITDEPSKRVPRARATPSAVRIRTVSNSRPSGGRFTIPRWSQISWGPRRSAPMPPAACSERWQVPPPSMRPCRTPNHGRPLCSHAWLSRSRGSRRLRIPRNAWRTRARRIHPLRFRLYARSRANTCPIVSTSRTRHVNWRSTSWRNSSKNARGGC